LARAAFSKARFHDGGEVWFNRALTQARRILQHDPTNPGALVITGLSLVALDRVDVASRYLDEASRTAPELPEVHYALGMMHRANSDRHEAIRELEIACRLAPDAWEIHMALGQLLQERADELGAPKRMIERSQYHLVRSLELEPDNPVRELLVHDLGVSCLRTARTADAHRLFMRLLDKPKFRRRAQYYLGLVSYKMGKYKNAILYFQQHLKNASTIESTPKRRRLELTRGPAENL
jgi:Flp pilus assembly protein TadD